jgi:hypothetical protein
MNPELMHQLASQRVSEVGREGPGRQLTAPDREPRGSVKERAGWALIHAGLKLTGPPSPHRPARPRPAGL